jgi:hypothetical protein
MSESHGGITGTVQEGATQVKDKGKETVTEQLDRRTTEAGTQARSLADALRRTGRQMETEGHDGSVGVTRMTSAVADRLERAGGYLERARGDQMLDDVERFARERPWVVAGAAAVAGFAASRLLKASSERRYERSRGLAADDTARGSWPDAGVYGTDAPREPVGSYAGRGAL